MNFAIRYLTEYATRAGSPTTSTRWRVRPATTSTQRVDDFHARVDPDERLLRHLDYYGTEVIEFGGRSPTTTCPSTCARTWSPRRPASRPTRAGALRPAPTRPRAASSCSPANGEPENGALDDLYNASRAEEPAGHGALLCELVPSLRVLPRGDLRRSTIPSTCSTPAPASARTSSTSGSCCCAATGSPRATCRATCGPTPRDGGS